MKTVRILSYFPILFITLFLLIRCDDEEDGIDLNDVGLVEIGTITDSNTGEIILTSVTVNRTGSDEMIAAEELTNIEVIDYASSTIPFEITLLGIPGPNDSIPSPPPAPGTRSEVIEDLVINSNINNPSAAEGMIFRFVDNGGIPTSILNKPGPDIIILEVGPPIGAPVPGGFTSVGGDPFQLWGVGPDSVNTATFLPEDYIQLGPDGFAANMSFYSNVPPGSSALPLFSLMEFESATLELLTVTDLNLYGLAIDLSDLGFASDATVGELNIRKEGTSFGVDPALIVALPTL